MNVGYILFLRENFSLYSFFIVPFCQLIFKAFFFCFRVKVDHSTICKQPSTCIKNEKHLGWVDSILFFLKWKDDVRLKYLTTSKLVNLKTYPHMLWVTELGKSWQVYSQNVLYFPIIDGHVFGSLSLYWNTDRDHHEKAGDRHWRVDNQ